MWPALSILLMRVGRIRQNWRAAGFNGEKFGGHSLKRGALTMGMDQRVYPALPKRLGRHRSFDVLGYYLGFGDLFERHPLSGVL